MNSQTIVAIGMLIVAAIAAYKDHTITTVFIVIFAGITIAGKW